MGEHFFRILAVGNFLPENNLRGALGSHHGNFGAGPGKIDVAADMLGVHHIIGAAVSLACNHGHFGHGGFGKGIEQFGPVLDDAAPFLVGAGQESGNVFENHQRNVEGVAEADKTRPFQRTVDIQHPGKMLGLIGHHADGITIEAGKTND